MVERIRAVLRRVWAVLLPLYLIVWFTAFLLHADSTVLLVLASLTVVFTALEIGRRVRRDFR
jgi:hypothetical protein